MPPKRMPEPEAYEPEKVVDSRGSGKNIEYFVKWVGYKAAENTWEPAVNLASCKEMITEYNKSQAKAPTKASPAAKSAAKPATKPAAKPATKPAKAAAKPAAAPGKAAIKPAAAPVKAAARSPAKPKKAVDMPLSLTRPKRGVPEPVAAPKAKKSKVTPEPSKPKPVVKAAAPPKPAPKPAPKPVAKKPAAKPSKSAPTKRITKAAAKPARKPVAKPAAKGKSKGEVLEVERILAMRSSTKGVEYQILWKGSGKKRESTWEPEENIMDDDLVDDFEEMLQEKLYGNLSFEAGQKVEVRNVDVGFDNSWTVASVQKIKGQKLTVEYSAFVDDKGKKMTDNVTRSRLRPTQAAAASSWTPQVGEIVEVNDADCWWEARVQSVKGRAIKVMFRVSDEVKDLALGNKLRPCAWLKMAAPAK